MFFLYDSNLTGNTVGRGVDIWFSDPTDRSGISKVESKSESEAFFSSDSYVESGFGVSNSHIFQHIRNEIYERDMWRQTTEKRTRWWRSKWMWSMPLSTDTSGIRLQTQKCMQNTSWEWTRVHDQQKSIYRPTRNPRSSPEPLEWVHWLQDHRLSEN